MNTSFPFSFLQSFAQRLQPPAWLVDEGQQRFVLFLNHVLMAEKEAQDRLRRKKGNVIQVRGGVFVIDLLITPAGLFDRALAGPDAPIKADLLVIVDVDSPVAMVQSLFAGKAPLVKIEGDVQLAAELGWLAENLRWDLEEDLSRIVGDIPAHAVADVGRRIFAGLKQFIAKGASDSSAASEVTNVAKGATTNAPLYADVAARASA